MKNSLYFGLLGLLAFSCTTTEEVIDTNKTKVDTISLNRLQGVYKHCLLEGNESYQAPLGRLFKEVFQVEDRKKIKTRLELDYNLEKDAYILIHGRIYSGKNTLYFSHNTGSTILLSGRDGENESVEGATLRVGQSLEEIKTTFETEKTFYNKYGKNLENERVLVNPKIESKYMETYQDTYLYLSEDKKFEIPDWHPFEMKSYVSCLKRELKASQSADYVTKTAKIQDPVPTASPKK